MLQTFLKSNGNRNIPFFPTNPHEVTPSLPFIVFSKLLLAPRRVGGSILLFFFLFVQSFSQTTKFSQENASAILRTLAIEIGPRPMGSPAEQRAMQFAVLKFNEYGCDTSYIMPMTVASNVNTNSGVAIGVKKGRTDRIIVIGGHIDTTPDSPGANDDGSGTACVIELARVLCERDNESTIYFCCWGGEEQGLRGSSYFVNNFEHLDSVALMLQIDMADGAGKLQADPDGSKRSAPAWLAKAAFDIFYNELPHTGLVYATEEATWNLAVGGAFGSDHSSFIDKGIPAIDFTSDPTFPIHTPQDRWENFTPSGLQRAGDLVLKLFERFDNSVPSRTTERYQLVQIGKNVFFVPYAMLWIFIGVSIVTLVAAFIVARAQRVIQDPSTRVRWSRFKLLLAALVIQIFIWGSESLFGFFKGYRFPWVNNIAGFKVLGALFGLLGLCLVLFAVRKKYRLSNDQYVFALPSLIIFLLLTAGTSLLTPEFGMFFAASSLAFAVAVIGRKPMFKLLFFALSFLICYSVLFFDGLPLFQRVLAMNTMSKWWQNLLTDAGFVVFFTVLSLPFVYGFAGVYRGSGVDLLWLKRFGTRGSVIVTSLAIVAVGGFLFTRPVYGKLWYNATRVEQLYTIGDDTSAVTIKGSEYVNGLSGTLDGRDTTFLSNTNIVELKSPKGSRIEWVDLSRVTSAPTGTSDSTWKIDRTVTIHSRFRPIRVDVTYESEKPFEISSIWAHGLKSPSPSERENEKRKRFRWAYFPDTLLTIPVSFTLSDSQSVQERVEIMLDSVAYPVRLRREFTNVTYRTIVSARDSFSVTK